MNFHIRSMFCIASINTNLEVKADIDRLTALTVRAPAPNGSSDDKWPQLEEELHKLKNDENISRRLLARCLNMMPIIHENIAVFIKAAALKFGAQRQGDQFGTLAAGAWCLSYSRVASLDEASKMLDSYDWNEHTENLDQDDALKALESVMSAKVKVGMIGDLSVYELVREACPSYRKGVLEQQGADDALRRHGIRLDIKADQLIFGTSISPLKQLVANCPFVTDLRGQLMRLQGAVRIQGAMRFNGMNSKCVAIPLSRLLEGEDRADEMPPI
jgi:putative DNA primase/helicase